MSQVIVNIYKLKTTQKQERQQNCLWKLIYKLLGHDEFKRCSMLDTLSQCAYVLKLATFNSNLCFSTQN